jgi:uncharacterized protein
VLTNLAKAWVVSAALVALAPFGAALALEVPVAPSLDRPIVDQTNTLTPEQIDSLAAQINTSRQQKDYQLGILVISSLQNEAIEDYSIKVARDWGIGTKEQNNGVLLLVAKDDRRLRIEVGRGLEGDLTDAESGRIIRNTISPQFKKGDYYGGISQGVQNIAAQVEGRPDQDTSSKVTGDTNIGGFAEAFAFLMFIGFGMLSWFASMLARSKSWWAGGVVGGVIGLLIMLVSAWALWAIILTVILAIGGLILDWAVSRNFANHASRGENASWWAGGPWIGGSGGSSGWGGGGGFGGGGFGGGGSSGGW